MSEFPNMDKIQDALWEYLPIGSTVYIRYTGLTQAGDPRVTLTCIYNREIVDLTILISVYMHACRDKHDNMIDPMHLYQSPDEMIECLSDVLYEDSYRAIRSRRLEPVHWSTLA